MNTVLIELHVKRSPPLSPLLTPDHRSKFLRAGPWRRSAAAPPWWILPPPLSENVGLDVDISRALRAAMKGSFLGERCGEHRHPLLWLVTPASHWIHLWEDFRNQGKSHPRSGQIHYLAWTGDSPLNEVSNWFDILFKALAYAIGKREIWKARRVREQQDE